MVGTPDPVKDASECWLCRTHGLPIIIKAAFGGGGRGMKIAWRMDEVAELYESAVREAVTAFGRGECFVEQFLDKPRHIEAQVLADTHGNVVVLGTRDCSLQRRNQKLVEELPRHFERCPARTHPHRCTRHLRRRRLRERRHGGVLLSQSGAISFLEVNTRLQVEHPVTEQTTGVDLVVEQLRVADGLPLSITQTPAPLGHSFEFASTPKTWVGAFCPTPGPVQRFDAPSAPACGWIRACSRAPSVPGTFDSLMAKLIVTGATREQVWPAPAVRCASFRSKAWPRCCPSTVPSSTTPTLWGLMASGHTRWIESDFATPLAARGTGRARGRHQPAAHRHRDRWPPCAAGLACRAAARLGGCGRQGAAAAPAEAAVDAAAVTSRHRRQPARLEGGRWRHGARGRCDRRDGSHEDGDAGDGTPRWAWPWWQRRALHKRWVR